MGQYHITKAGNIDGGASGPNDALRALAQTMAKQIVVGDFPIVDNSTGVPNVNGILYFPPVNTDVAASGSNLATKATVDSALGAIQNAIATLMPKAIALASELGLKVPTFSGGGTNGNGTVAAISPVVAGATTGPTSASVNAISAAINQEMYTLAAIVRKVTIATGDQELVMDGASSLAAGVVDNHGTIAAVPTTSSVAGATGITAAAMSTLISAHAANIATIAAAMNAVASAAPPKLIASS